VDKNRNIDYLAGARLLEVLFISTKILVSMSKEI
jgi:hypothetical protein